MTDSRALAGLIGPTLIALGSTEALNVDIFAGQTPTVVYLNGGILFVVGLALVRAHNRWAWSWPTIVTLTGWLALLLGLYRMIAPTAPQAPQSGASYAVFAGIALIGAFLTYKAYRAESAR